MQLQLLMCAFSHNRRFFAIFSTHFFFNTHCLSVGVCLCSLVFVFLMECLLYFVHSPCHNNAALPRLLCTHNELESMDVFTHVCVFLVWNWINMNGCVRPKVHFLHSNWYKRKRKESLFDPKCRCIYECKSPRLSPKRTKACKYTTYQAVTSVLCGSYMECCSFYFLLHLAALSAQFSVKVSTFLHYSVSSLGGY